MRPQRQFSLPPRLSSWLIRALFPDRGSFSPYGDLCEAYQHLTREKGRLYARLWFRAQLLKAIPAFFKEIFYWRIIMLKSYLKIALRYMRNQKIYAFINIAGLAVGIACTLLITFWVRDELGFDKFHARKNRIYRIYCLSDNNFFATPAPLAPALIEEVPEVENAARLVQAPRFVFQYGDKAFYEDNGIVADPALFEIFSFPFVKGDPETAFSGPGDIVLTAGMAEKYFGEEDPLGKTLRLEGRGNLRVTGIIKDIPPNSHFRFDYVLPYRFALTYRIRGLQWGDFNFRAYILTPGPIDPVEVAGKINTVAKQHGCPQIVNGELTFALQSLDQIYLNPIGNYDIPLGNKKFVYLFSVIAFFIIFIACINFINLSTARSEKRAREVGMRKVLGAYRIQVIQQHFSESLLMVLTAAVLGTVLSLALIPAFNQLTGKQFTFHLFDLGIISVLLILAVLIGIIAGLYPALHLSSFSPAHAIKGQVPFFRWQRSQSKPGHRGTLRKFLVVTQFALSIILIVSTLIVFYQLRYIRNKSWSLKEDLVLHIPVKENIGPRYELVKNRLLEHSDISAVGIKDCLPTTLRNNTSSVGWEGKTEDQNNIYMETTRVGFDYFKTMGMEITAGRDFSPDFQGDIGSAFVLNEEAVRRMGTEDPVGKRFRLYGTRGRIVGIVRDTHFHSLRQQLRPQVYHLFTNTAAQTLSGTVLIRVRGPFTKNHSDKIEAVITHLKAVWNEVNSFAPFEYHFLDNTIEAHYLNERKLGILFSYFAALAVMISCLGLFGLAAFTSEQRTKEIGIRKTLGASAGSITVMLSKEFTKWVLTANLIAVPVAWYAMHRWLQNFAYRTSISVWAFFFAGLLALIIAWLTIGIQTFRSARINPVNALRYE